MTSRQRRMLFVGVIVLAMGGAAMLMTRAFKENMMYFITPSDVLADSNTANKSFRLGGMVKEGSVQRSAGSMNVRFVVTDLKHELPVSYTGVIPDLFREGQGVIARGKFVDATFVAEEVLAKHDEKYMPPEVAEKLKENHDGRLPSSTPSAGSSPAPMAQ
ncbi:MAG: cytochrome c maturation protein CcmE [Candidatus Obscuribacterales bacterium]|nr:cytochrome c maturation protein CcmE [Steroidobacteraceae bacterium]